MTTEPPLRLLSLDGGGVRGVSELLILEQLMLFIKKEQKLASTPKPCEYFDLICGTSTGGLIAILLGRLKLSVEEAIEEYRTISEKVFSKPKSKLRFSEGIYPATILENTMKDVVRRHAAAEQMAEDLTLLENNDEAVCKVFVCTRNARAMNIPRLFRSYSSHTVGEYENATIWQAGRATSAAPKFFKRLKIGKGTLQEEFLDGGMGSNNPTKILIDEVGTIHPDRSISCIISIGAGKADVIEVEAPSFLQRLVPIELINALKDMATDCEATALEMNNKFRECPNLYFRFNVEQGLQNVRLDKWEELGNIKAKTIQYLDEHKATVNEAAQALLRNEAKCTVKDLGPMIPRDDQGSRRTLTQAAQECLRSLAFPQMDDRAKDIASAADGTCDWLLQHSQFLEWVDSQDGLFWIQGKPGSGKSTLLRHFLDNIQMAKAIQDTDLVLSFFFHARGNELQKTPLGFYRSLVHQLLSQVPIAVAGLVSHFENWTNTKKQKADQEYEWTPCELQKELEQSLRKTLVKSPVWLFVDALDECGKENARELIDYFNYLVQALRFESSELHICFTCRHYPKLHQDIDFQVCLESENRDDISTWVKAKLPTADLELISDLIIDRAAGVFMWARLVVERIRDLQINGYGETKMKETLDVIPKDLNKLYVGLVEDIVNGEDVQRKSDAVNLIFWVSFALRPMTIDELSWAMAIKDGRSYNSPEEFVRSEEVPNRRKMIARVLDLSSGLLEVTDSLVVQFIHQSVIDFFMDKGLAILNTGTTSLDAIRAAANWQLFRTCISYLEIDGVNQVDNINRANDIVNHENEDGADGSDKWKGRQSGGFTLLRYATTSWIKHLSFSTTGGLSHESLINTLGRLSKPFLRQWSEVYPTVWIYGDDPPSDISLLHVLSRYGLAEFLRFVLTHQESFDSEVDERNGRCRTPLMYAAERGHEAIVSLLLEHGAHTGPEHEHHQTPLSLAVLNGHEAVTEMLLGRDEGSIEWTDSVGRTLLWYAAGDNNIKDSFQPWGRYASWYEKESQGFPVVKLLIERGAKVDLINRQDSQGSTVLASRIMEWDSVVPRMLLQHGANVDPRDINCRTPLWNVIILWSDEDDETEVPFSKVKAHQFYSDILCILLEFNADRELEDEEGQTPLRYVAAKGNYRAVTILLRMGAQIDSFDRTGRTALSWASENGHDDIVQVLCEKGAEIDFADHEGRTPLSWASQNGHDNVAQVLLDAESEINSTDKNGRTALSRASEGGHEDLVRLLLIHHAESTLSDRQGWSPLWYAMARSYDSVMHLLLELGDVNWVDKNDWPILHHAAITCSDWVLQQLISRGADIEATDMQGRTCLLWAVQRGCHDAVQFLLDSKANVECRDEQGRSPLIWAAQQGDVAMAKLLFRKNVLVDSVDNQGRTPLAWAAWKGRADIVQLLSKHGANVNSEDVEGRTPLWYARWDSHDAVTEWLLEKGAYGIQERGDIVIR